MATKKKPSRTRESKAQLQERRKQVSRSWLTQPAYRGIDTNPWDENAPAIEIPVYGLPPATLVPALQAALTQLEQGSFYSCAYLWDGMLRDDRITATLNVRLDGLFGSEIEIEPAKDTGRARTIAEDVEERWGKMAPTPVLKQLQRNAIGLSVGIAQRLHGQFLKSDTPTIKVWNNRYLRYDWLLRKYCLVTENRGEIALEPGDPEWIIYEPFGPLGWLHGALIRSLVQPWVIRYWTRTWWARYQEVHGQPIRAGIIPPDRDPTDERTFLSQLSNMAHEAVIRLPQGEDGNKFDMKLIEAESNNWKGFLELLSHCDRSIEIVLLGQSQSTEGQGGLGTQEKAGESTIVRILRGDAAIGDVLREQHVMPWVENEYGDAEMAPFVNWQVDPPEDEEKLAGIDLKVAQALVQFKTAGVPIDIRAYLEERGYPLLSEEEHDAQKQKAVEDAQAMMQATTPPKPEDDGEDEQDDQQAKAIGDISAKVDTALEDLAYLREKALSDALDPKRR